MRSYFTRLIPQGKTPTAPAEEAAEALAAVHEEKNNRIGKIINKCIRKI